MNSCMLFGRFRSQLSFSLHQWFLWRKVLFCSQHFPAFIATGNSVLWDSEGKKRSLSPMPLSSSKSTFYSARHRDLYQVRWSDDSDLWHRSRWQCQSPKCGGRSGKKVSKTIVRVCLSTACRCLLRRQVLVNLVPKFRPDSSAFNLMKICIPKQVIIRIRWKFSLRRRHPHWTILLSRCCLFQCRKIILKSAFNMQ